MKVKLTDVCTPKQWKTISTNELLEKGYPVYGANGLIGHYSEYNHEQPVVTITCRGATCGAVNVTVPKSYVNGNAMCLDNLCPNVLLHYLYYCLLHYDFSHVISGSAQPQITRQGLEKVEIEVCSIEQQIIIVDSLRKIEAVITARQQQLHKLDELVKARFVEMFGDPVDNSKNFSLVPLGQLGVLKRGVSKHRPRNDAILLGGKYPLIQTGDVSNAKDYITEYTSTYSEEGLKQSKMWSKGTLCITIAANIADTAILAFDACFPDSVVGFIPNEKVTTLFIHNWFKFLQPILEENAPAVAQKNLNVATLEKTNVIVPPIDLQKEFELFVHQLDKSKFVEIIELLNLLIYTITKEVSPW